MKTPNYHTVLTLYLFILETSKYLKIKAIFLKKYELLAIHMTMKNNNSSGIPTISSPGGIVCKKIIGGEHLFLLLITIVCGVSSV